MYIINLLSEIILTRTRSIKLQYFQVNLRNKRLTWEWRRGYVCEWGRGLYVFFFKFLSSHFIEKTIWFSFRMKKKFSGENSRKKRENNLNGRSLDKLTNTTLLRVVIPLRLTHGCKQFILIKSLHILTIMWRH
jgi:hypothetical protein